MNPQFNREGLQQVLRAHGTKYVFLGKELGARAKDPTCYQDGKVQYDRLARTDLFQHGLERVKTGTATFRIALMCAEKDPLDCHRTILVARNLADEGMTIRHILADGTSEEHGDSIERLLGSQKAAQDDLFMPREERVNAAYRRRGEQIAYQEKEARPRVILPRFLIVKPEAPNEAVHDRFHQDIGREFL